MYKINHVKSASHVTYILCSCVRAIYKGIKDFSGIYANTCIDI